MDTHTRPAAAASLPSVMQGAVTLSAFVTGAGDLTLDDRLRIVDQALVLFEHNYVHLSLKRAMHAVEPVQALRLLRHQLEISTAETMPAEVDFHRRLLAVFTSVRDLHTNYLLPAPFADKIAFLPFDVEEYGVDGHLRYAVSHLVPGFTAEHFDAGVEITHWNGVPADRAVLSNAERFAGSNSEARRARGLQFLTRRPLRTAMAPDEQWVVVGYTDAGGTARELRSDWLVATLPPRPNGVDAGRVSPAAAALGMDLEMELNQRIRKALFAPSAAERRATADRRPAGSDAGEELDTTLPDYFRARRVTTGHGTFGHLRIFGFNIDDPDAFIAEFLRLAGQLPEEGLIIDVRGNGGGHIHASEGLLQVLTPRRIDPEPTQFATTSLNLRICRRHRDNPVGLALGEWVESMEQAVQTGAAYSRGVPITPPDWANAMGQRYQGPVVLVTDALCYSATDIFAAGFQDHGIGPVVGVDANTGAGGANVWTHELLSEVLRQPPPPDGESPYRPLPGGAGMRVSIRRTLRVGAQAGTPLEDLGVVPDVLHEMTRDDLLHDNRDLLEEAGALLAARPVRRLRARLTGSGGATTLRCDTVGLDRVDVLLAGRPFGSFDVVDGPRDVPISRTVTGGVKVLGFAGGDLVVATRL
ncbi:MAG: S41 family peptidase [Egibacteraceae bacterium]